MGRRLRGPLLLALALTGALACSVIVEGALNSAQPPGACPDQPFYNDTTPVRFDAGVGLVTFHGPSWPQDAQATPASVTVLSFASQLVVARASDQDTRVGINFDLTLGGATQLFAGAGHERNRGPCEQVLVGHDDTFHGTTGYTLFSTCDQGGLVDAGTVPLDTDRNSGIGWSSADGGQLGLIVGGTAQACSEDLTKGLSCTAPVAAPAVFGPGGPHQIEALQGPGVPVWLVSRADNSAQLFSPGFGSAPVVLGTATTMVAIRPDIAVLLNIDNAGNLAAGLVNADGGQNGASLYQALNDPQATGLTANRLPADTQVRLAWVGGDHEAHVADLDLSNPASLQLGPARTVCGGGGAVRFAAPVNGSTVLTVTSDGAAHLRPTPP